VTRLIEIAIMSPRLWAAIGTSHVAPTCSVKYVDEAIHVPFKVASMNI